jgi:hypothetical protein
MRSSITLWKMFKEWLGWKIIRFGKWGRKLLPEWTETEMVEELVYSLSVDKKWKERHVKPITESERNSIERMLKRNLKRYIENPLAANPTAAEQALKDKKE